MHSTSVNLVSREAVQARATSSTPGTGVRILVHGDDFVAVGEELAMRAWQVSMEQRFPCKTTIIGPGDGLEKEVKVIGRWIRITGEGVEVEVDGRYLEQALKAYGLEDAKPVVTPATKKEPSQDEIR